VANICDRCGRKTGFFTETVLPSGDYICGKCSPIVEKEKVKERKKEVIKRQRLKQLEQAADKIIVTTTPSVDGYHVRKYLGVESVEYVIGTGIFSELSSGIADFFGRRSSAFEQKLQTAKKNAMDGLKMIAAEQGANAIIGLDLDYSEFSGNRVVLIINGTLVRLAQGTTKPKRIEDAPGRTISRPL